MEYKNFSISRSRGKLYLKEKQPTEGYEEVTYGSDNSKTYHQYHDSIKGVPKEFGVKEIEYQGRKLRFLEFALEDGNTVNKVSVNLKNKGGYTDETKALLSALRGLEVGEEVSLNPVKSTSTGKNGKTYENLNIYINYLGRTDANGKNPSTGYINFSEIPAPTSSVVAGDKVWDFTPQTEFYYNVLQEIEAKFKGGAQANSSPQKTATPQEAFAKVDTNKSFLSDDSDDLPFN